MTGPIAPAGGGRERYLDVYRAIALVRVGMYHVFGYAWLSILFPAMGVMFAVAGSLTARSLDRAPAASVIGKRMRRLLPSLWLLGIVVVPAMLLHGWTAGAEGSPLRWNDLVYWIVPVFDPPGSDWGANATSPLWYVRAYLWFVVLSPLLLWAFRRWPVRTALAPLALIASATVGWPDLDSIGASGDALRDFGTYGTCWVLGFAHRAGTLRRIPLPVAVLLAAVTMTAGLSWALTHAGGEFGYDLNEIPLAQALWSAGVVLVLLRWEPNLDRVDQVPVLGRMVTLITARAVTIYLWHNVAIDLAVVVNDRVGLYGTPELVVTAVLLTGVAILLFGWVEDLAARRPVQLVPGFSRRAARGRRRVRTSGATPAGTGPTPARERRTSRLAGRLVVAGGAAMLLVAWVGPPLANRVTEPEHEFTAGAYLVPWDNERGIDAMAAASDVLDSVSPVWYTPTDNGELVRSSETEGSATVIKQARAAGLSVIPSISNFRDGEWDADLVSRIVHEPRLRRAHVEAVVDEVVTHEWDGIDLDYEALDVVDHDEFCGFVAELAAALHEQDRKLTVAVPAGTAESRPELARLYKRLGKSADEVRVMAYDFAWQGSEPGPIAPTDWVDDVLAFVVRQVPPERVVLGLPGHAYDWGSGAQAKDLMFTEAEQLAENTGSKVHWNADAQVPWFAYTDADGLEHEVWFEDAPSLAAKLEVAHDYDVGGIFLWRLGGEDPRTWAVLERMTREW